VKRQRVPWVPIVVLLSVLAAVAYWRARPPRLRPQVLANAPAGSVAVARVDPAALLASPLWRTLVTDRGGDRGLRRLREQCGFDPAAALDEMMVFVLGAETRSLDHVVFAARGAFDHDSLGACMREVVESQGGGLRRTEVEGVPAVAGRRGESRIAFVGDGAIFGLEEAVAQVVRTVRGEPSLLADGELVAAWESVRAGTDLAFVARVPSSWRRLFDRGVGFGALLRAPLRDLRTLAFGARLGEGLGLRLRLRYTQRGRAAQVESWLRERRAAAVEEASDGTLGAALQALELASEGDTVSVDGALSPGQLEALLAELGAFAASR